MSESTKITKKVHEGVVVSTKMDKVAVVLMERFLIHPLYKKRIKKSKKFFVRDEKNSCKEGDKVTFVSCRPYSKKTVFELKEIVTKEGS